MSDFSLIDDDEKAFTKKPKPIGWFVAGAVSIASVTLALSHYLPLKSAHQTLATQHGQLAKKSAELDHALKTDRATLTATDTRKRSLERFIAAGAQSETELNTSFELAAATIQNQLAPFIKAKLVQLELRPEALVISVADKLLFRGPTSALSPQAGGTVCKAVSHLASEKDWHVAAVTRSSAEDTKYWETATERSASLALLLEQRCKIERDRIEPQAMAPLEGEDSAKKTTLLMLRPANATRFLASDAPEEASGATADESEANDEPAAKTED